MKHRTAFWAIGMVLLAAGCTTDPLASLRAGPARLVLSAAVLAVNVGDSVAVTATAVDEQGNPLPDLPTATSTTPTIVSVITGSGAPLPQARFFLKGVAFGTGNVDVKVGGVTKSITVKTYPATVSVTGRPDSLGSGVTVVLTAEGRSATGQPVAGVIPISWAVDDNAVVTLVVSPTRETATVTGKNVGVANVTVTFTGGQSTTFPVLVVPGPWAGTLSSNTGAFSDLITATRAAGELDFSGSTGISVGGNAVYLESQSASAVSFRLPPTPATGPQPILFTGLGTDALSKRIMINMTTAGGMEDPGEPANDDPATAPALTNGTFFITLHGVCTNGAPQSGGDECDDFFRITNSSGSAASVTVTVDWPDDSDVDILWCNAACSAFVGNFTGATGANPETSTVSVANGVTINLWLNLFAPGSENLAYVRVVVSGAP